MVVDASVLTSVQQQWAGLMRLCSGSHRQCMIPGGPFINETPPESFYNLPLLLAYGCLDEVLGELINQGTVLLPASCRRPLLGDKMAASRHALPWQNYDLVSDGKDHRNKLAHEAVLHNRQTCLRFIEAIEVEFRAWRVL